jgi:1-deoxy-D-xylulose-5-phosphate reductoisomerase
MLFFS